MIDLSSFTYVDLGNYIKHRQNYVNFMQGQQRQSDKISEELDKVIECHTRQTDCLERQIKALEQLDSLEQSDYDTLKAYYTFEQSVTCDATEDLILQWSRELIKTAITNLYRQEVHDMEGMYQQDAEKNLLLAILVETDYCEFNLRETVCHLVEHLLHAFYAQFKCFKQAKIDIRREGDYIGIEVYLRGHAAPLEPPASSL